MDRTDEFEAERPRLLRVAGRLLGNTADAEDVVQLTWLRLHGTDARIDNLPGWLTTVATRLCLDRLRARIPVVESGPQAADDDPDPADQVVLAETVGAALDVVLDALPPAERVAFVLHDSFAVDFATVAGVLDTTPVAARKLASRARARIGRAGAPDEGGTADWQVVDAFLAAARTGDFARLLALLAPGVVVAGDAAAVAIGTPARIDGRAAVAAMFDGAAKAARPVLTAGRPGAAWIHRGEARVVFDFTITDGQVHRIDFRADPAVLAAVVRRRGDAPARRA